MNHLDSVAKSRHLAESTVDCYRRWLIDFLSFHRVDGTWRHPRELRVPEVAAFLTYLAKDRQRAASTQNQACNAIVFLYRHVLADELPADHLGRFVAERSRVPRRVVTVLSENEVRRIIDEMPAESQRTIMVRLMYGTGLRVMECCTVRIRDLDF